MTATVFRLVVPPELSHVTPKLIRADSLEEIRAAWADLAGLQADQYELLVRWEAVPGLRALEHADLVSQRGTWCDRRGLQVIVAMPKGREA